jgi:hypothetical protein
MGSWKNGRTIRLVPHIPVKGITREVAKSESKVGGVGFSVPSFRLSRSLSSLASDSTLFCLRIRRIVHGPNKSALLTTFAAHLMFVLPTLLIASAARGERVKALGTWGP